MLMIMRTLMLKLMMMTTTTTVMMMTSKAMTVPKRCWGRKSDANERTCRVACSNCCMALNAESRAQKAETKTLNIFVLMHVSMYVSMYFQGNVFQTFHPKDVQISFCFCCCYLKVL